MIKVYNFLLNQLSRKVFKNTYAFGYPIHLTIEATNLCNLNCPMCGTGKNFSTRKKGQISFNAFKQIIDELGKYLYVVGPFNLGEPLLHKEIFNMISYAQKKNITTVISTNGILLTKDIVSKIIESGLEELFISIDAATEKTYNIMRPGGDFAVLIENIKFLVQEKKKRKSKTPYIIAQMVVTKYNENEVNDFKKMTDDLGVDRYLLSDFWEQYLGNSSAEEETVHFYPAQEKYKNLGNTDLLVKDTCRWAWSGSVINWDGTVIPCCYDYNETYIIGNIFKDGFKQLWNNVKYRRLRQEIKKGRKNIPLCKKCPRARPILQT